VNYLLPGFESVKFIRYSVKFVAVLAHLQFLVAFVCACGIIKSAVLCSYQLEQLLLRRD